MRWNSHEAIPIKGGELRRQRLAADLTQEGLAWRATITRATVHRLERVRAVTTPRTLQLIATALATDPATLLDDAR